MKFFWGTVKQVQYIPGIVVSDIIGAHDLSAAQSRRSAGRLPTLSARTTTIAERYSSMDEPLNCVASPLAAVSAPVSAIGYDEQQGLLFVGMANVMRVYSLDGMLLSSDTVLPAGEAIHGCVPLYGGAVAIFGIREVRCHVCQLDRNAGQCVLMPAFFALHLRRRVLCIAGSDGGNNVGTKELVLGIGTDENAVHWFAVDVAVAADASSAMSPFSIIRCTETPLLYALALHSQPSSRWLAVAGSAFRSILCFDCTSSSSTTSSSSVTAGIPPQPAQSLDEQRRAPICRLTGHEGAIFKVVPSISGQWLASVSDDRRVILWPTPNVSKGDGHPLPATAAVVAPLSPSSAAQAKFEDPQRGAPTASVRGVAGWFAHGARVWDVSFLAERGGSVEIDGESAHESVHDGGGRALGEGCQRITLATSGEDSLVKLWGVSIPFCSQITGSAGSTRGEPSSKLSSQPSAAEVTLLVTLRGHDGKHVWCVAGCIAAHDRKALALASGGADGAVKLWPVQQYMREQEAATAAKVTQHQVPAGSAVPSSGSGHMDGSRSAMTSTTTSLICAGAAGQPAAAGEKQSASAIRALALLGPAHVVVADGVGGVHLMELEPSSTGSAVGEAASEAVGEAVREAGPLVAGAPSRAPAPPVLLHSAQGMRWSRVQASIGDEAAGGGARVVVGSASGDILLLELARGVFGGSGGAGSSVRSREGLHQLNAGTLLAADALRWKAHTTCIMQFAWAPPSDGSAHIGAPLASADSTGQLALWSSPPAAPAPVTAAATPSTAIAAGMPADASSPPRLLDLARPMPGSQRITAIAAAAGLCDSSGAAAPIVLLCGGSSGALRALWAEGASSTSSSSASSAAPEERRLPPDDDTLLPTAHGTTPVTHILASSNDTDGGDTGAARCSVFSCGRNGIVNEYELSVVGSVGADAAAATSQRRLRLSVLRSWRCSVASILECLLPTPDGLAVLGFLQSDALIWSVNGRQELARWPTKGYRHPKDASLVPLGAGGGAFLLAYAHAQQVHAHRSRAHTTPGTGGRASLASVDGGSLDGSGSGGLGVDRDGGRMTAGGEGGVVRARSLHQNFHGREGLCVLPTDILERLRGASSTGLSNAANPAPRFSFVTGSEDNTIKLMSCSVDLTHASEGHGSPPEPLRVESTLEGHPAPVRALALSVSDSGAAAALFSAGGKEAIHSWKLQPERRGSGSGSGGGAGGAGRGTSSGGGTAGTGPYGSLDKASSSSFTTSIRAALLCTRVPPERNSGAAKRKGTAHHRSEAQADSRFFALAAEPLPMPSGRPAHLLAASTSQAQVDLFVLLLGDGEEDETATAEARGAAGGETARVAGGSDGRARLLPLGRLECEGGPQLCLSLRRVAANEMTGGGKGGEGGGTVATFLLSGGTNGALSVWDLQPLLDGWTPGPTDASGWAPLQVLDGMRPICIIPGLHAMGVNAMCLLPIQPGPPPGARSSPEMAASATLLIASGGDDQSVGLSALGLSSAVEAAGDSQDGGGSRVCVWAMAHGLRDAVHSAGVRGISAVGRKGNFILTVGGDGRLRGWGISPLASGLMGAEGKASLCGNAEWARSMLRPLWSCVVSIEQIHALCVCGGGGARFGASADEEEREVEEVAAVVVGGGVEVFSMALLGRPGGETEQALELRERAGNARAPYS